MTKAEIVAGISEETGLERSEALRAVEAFMLSIKRSLSDGQNVYLRGFGSFVVKRRAKKQGEIFLKKQLLLFQHIIFHLLNRLKFLLKRLKTT